MPLSEANGVNDPTTPATLFQGRLHTTMRGNHGVCVSVTVHDYYHWHWVTLPSGYLFLEAATFNNFRMDAMPCVAFRGMDPLLTTEQCGR